MNSGVSDLLAGDEFGETVYVTINILPGQECTRPVVARILVQKNRTATAQTSEGQRLTYEEVILTGLSRAIA
jgi:hypothetical protein